MPMNLTPVPDPAPAQWIRIGPAYPPCWFHGKAVILRYADGTMTFHPEIDTSGLLTFVDALDSFLMVPPPLPPLIEQEIEVAAKEYSDSRATPPGEHSRFHAFKAGVEWHRNRKENQT